jgi:hypothetical protein
MISTRKYNSVFRKILVSKCENIKNKEDLISIFNIIKKDIGNNFSSNRNGIFININILTDNCINELCEFVNRYNNIANKLPIRINLNQVSNNFYTLGFS